MKMEASVSPDRLKPQHESVRAADKLLRDLHSLGLRKDVEVVIRFFPADASIPSTDKYHLGNGVGWHVSTVESLQNAVKLGREQVGSDNLSGIELLTSEESIYPFAVKGELVTFPDIDALKRGPHDEDYPTEMCQSAVAALRRLKTPPQ